MFDIFGSPPDHWTETGVATNTTAPIKVAPIKSIFCIVVLLNKDTRLILNHSANQLFELSRCKCLLICGCCLIKIEQWKSAVVFKIEHPAHTHALKISVLLSRPPKADIASAFMSTRPSELHAARKKVTTLG
jgi:hypothetical protein